MFPSRALSLPTVTTIAVDPRLSAFITHGGQGSVTEATLAGVPLIVVPIAVDQLRNGQMIKRIQTGVLVSKDRLGDVETIRGAIKEILYNPKYVSYRFLVENSKNI